MILFYRALFWKLRQLQQATNVTANCHSIEERQRACLFSIYSFRKAELRPLLNAAGCFLSLVVCAAFAQSQHQTVPEFDAVSVKLSTGADHGPPNSDGGPGTRYPEWFGTNSTLRMLISRAYGLIDSAKQISGPDWIDGKQFAVDARVPPGTSKEQFQQMLQKMLAERFGLAAHREAIMLPVYELVVAKNGPKLKASDFAPVVVSSSGTSPSADHDPNGISQFSGAGLRMTCGPGVVCHISAQQQNKRAATNHGGAREAT
jgi:uncharacterized protein (TIGR03435 family)